ncbi:hypothetical protein MTO96_003424 [Rhipicephalus appendiculatus]
MCQACYLSPSTAVAGSLDGHRRRSAASALGCRPSLSRIDNDELQPKAEGETARSSVAHTMTRWKGRRRRTLRRQLAAWRGLGRAHLCYRVELRAGLRSYRVSSIALGRQLFLFHARIRELRPAVSSRSTR